MATTTKLGSNIIQLDIIDSTNHFAENLMTSSDVPEGLVVIARKQTGGVGQGSNTWKSQAGKNLTLSLVLYPQFLAPEKMFLLNKAISLAVLDLVKSYISDQTCTIKWPNDIYIRDCKTAGILINNTIGGHVYESAVVGIGLNINQTCFTHDLPNPISLKHITKQEFAIKDVLHDLLVHLDERYDQLQKGDNLEEEYEKNLYRYKKKTVYLIDGKKVSGIIKGVDNYGKLLVEINNKIKSFNHGEITFMT